MNVKPGDLAILIKSSAGNEGKICKVLNFLGDNPVINGQRFCVGEGPCWLVEFPSPVRYSYGDVFKIAAAPDSFLRPVSGLPDEQHTEEHNKQEA